ncbi:hypothetical protein [Nocardia paucivorans]|uniref:hypothetical protein n=1 Tax=Nocardia paucivorans TaxID=114259 RepID=UPI0002F03ACA|nr:hypothetical protein [Nocardia paucivorans]
MTRDKQRKQAARQYRDDRGVRYRRAMRELGQRSEPVRGEGGSSGGCALVRQTVDEVEHQVAALQHIPAKPVDHRADHLGRCLSHPMYAAAVDLALLSAVHVGAAAGLGVVDEVSVYHAGQVVGHLTRASAVTRDAPAQRVCEARRHAVGLLEVTRVAMVASCELAAQVRMARNEWYCEVSGGSQACTAGARDLRLQVRDPHSGRVVEMPAGCVGHIAEEIVTWTGVPDIEIEVAGPAPAVVDLARQHAAGLRETEHWLFGPLWWEKQRTLAPPSPHALFGPGILKPAQAAR